MPLYPNVFLRRVGLVKKLVNVNWNLHNPYNAIEKIGLELQELLLRNPHRVSPENGNSGTISWTNSQESLLPFRGFASEMCEGVVCKFLRKIAIRATKKTDDDDIETFIANKLSYIQNNSEYFLSNDRIFEETSSLLFEKFHIMKNDIFDNNT